MLMRGNGKLPSRLTSPPEGILATHFHFSYLASFGFDNSQSTENFLNSKSALVPFGWHHDLC
jgi:hypothetical protein